MVIVNWQTNWTGLTPGLSKDLNDFIRKDTKLYGFWMFSCKSVTASQQVLSSKFWNRNWLYAGVGLAYIQKFFWWTFRCCFWSDSFAELEKIINCFAFYDGFIWDGRLRKWPSRKSFDAQYLKLIWLPRLLYENAKKCSIISTKRESNFWYVDYVKLILPRSFVGS